MLLSACATTPQPEQEPAATTDNIADIHAGVPGMKTASNEPEPVYRPFPEETLYALLVAEFAARREQYQLALGNYLDQAHQTQDIAVAARATRMAHFLKANRAAVDSAMLWASLEPENAEANYLAAMMLTRNQQPRNAMSYMNKVSELGGKTNFYGLAASTKDANTQIREQLIEDFGLLLTKTPNNTDLQLGKTLLLKQAKQYDQALTLVQQVLTHTPNELKPLILEAKLLLLLKRQKQAFKRIERQLEAKPDNQRLRLQYARLLTRVDLVQAQQQFFILSEQFPDDTDLIFSLALLYKENELTSDAKKRFQQLLSLGKHQSAAHYYLGQLAEDEGDKDLALTHYQSVQSGPDYISAVRQGVKLLMQSERQDEALALLTEAREQAPEEAVRLYLIQSDLLMQVKKYDNVHELLTQGLEDYPDDDNLLYARSMVSEKRDDLALMEQDLRSIIESNPNSSMALNALGYVLANRTDRLTEAEDLIQQALTLRPQDAAILDSMGWVLYRQGKHAEALSYLQQAMEKMADHEIAAHLGEVLWVMGDQQQAKAVWHKALQEQTDSPILLQVLEKFELTPEQLSSP